LERSLSPVRPASSAGQQVLALALERLAMALERPALWVGSQSQAKQPSVMLEP
jgi:hypothetical protein